MYSCCAIGCTNHQGEPDFRFYTFPKNAEQRNKWIAAVRRKNWEPGRWTKICSEYCYKWLV